MEFLLRQSERCVLDFNTIGGKMLIKLQSCSPEFVRECFPEFQCGSVVFDRKQEILFFLLEHSVVVNKSQWLELQSPSGEHKSWWGNGQLYSCGSWVDGNSEGEHKRWWENGQLSFCGSYVNGKQEGEHKSWWGNGQLRFCGSWVDGNPEGEHKRWWGNGQLYSCGSWVNGFREGEHKRWRENGQLEFCGSWVNGKLIEEYSEEVS